MREVFFELKSGIVTKKTQINLGEALSVIADEDLKEKIVNSNIYLNPGINTLDGFQVIRIIKGIDAQVKITPVGVGKCRIEVRKKRAITPWVVIKLIIIGLIMFFGGAIAIMHFHADIEILTIHSQMYEFVTGEKKEIVPLVSIPYSIGILFGFIFAMNIIKRKKNREPSLIDIDVNEYQKQVQDYIDQNGGDKS